MRPTLVFQGHTTGPDTFERCWRRSAALLAGAGVGDGDVVALMMRNSPLAIELMAAARHLGAQWCPVNWHFKTDEVQYILANSGAKVFIVDADLLDGLPSIDPGSSRTWPWPWPRPRPRPRLCFRRPVHTRNSVRICVYKAQKGSALPRS